MGGISAKSIPTIEGHSYQDVIDAITAYKAGFQERYMISYKWFIMQSIHNEMEGKNNLQKWHLQQRQWASYNRPLKQGYLYFLSEQFGKKWKKRYCVLQSDYSFQIFNSKENFETAGSCISSTKFSGFQVIHDVDAHLRGTVSRLCRDFGYINHDVSSIAKKVTLIGKAGKRPTQHVFCVSHTWRGIIYFAADTAIEKDYWLRVLIDGSRHLEGIQCDDEVAKRAFSFSVEHSIRCTDFPIDQEMLCGTPEEILIDMTADYQSNDCKSVVLPKIKGGISKKIKIWLFIMNALHDCIKGMVVGHFTSFQQSCHKSCNKLEIITNLPNYMDTYDRASKAIADELAKCFDPIVQHQVLPQIPDLMDSMNSSLISPMQSSRELFILLVDGVKEKANTSAQFANNLDLYFLHTLDLAPRDPQFTSSFQKADPKKALDKLKIMFPEMDFNTLLESIYVYQHQLLDSAVCTFESLCGEAVASNSGNLNNAAIVKIQARVLKKLHYDILLSQRRFLHGIILSGTMSLTRKSIEEQCKTKMLDFDMLIPNDLKEFMPITNVFTDVLTKRFTQLVKPEINTCIDKIVAHRALKARSSSTLSSVSSSISIVDDEAGFQVCSHKPIPPEDFVANPASTDSASDCQVKDTAMDGETGEMSLPNQSSKRSEGSVESVPQCQSTKERCGSDSGINEGSDSETNSMGSLERPNIIDSCLNFKNNNNLEINQQQESCDTTDDTGEACVANITEVSIHSEDLPVLQEPITQNCGDLNTSESIEPSGCVCLPQTCTPNNCEVDRETGNVVLLS